MEELLLHGQFQMLPSCSMFYDVTLTRQNIMFVEASTNGKKGKLMSILMDNIIGCKLYSSKLNRDICSYFKVISLTKDKKNMRQKHTFTFRVNGSVGKDDNYEIAENWACMISWLIYNPDLSVDEIRAKEYFPPQRKYFVAINPKSGPGKSLQLFKNTIEQLFHEANIKYDVLITEYAGQIMELALTFDYTQWDAFVICSGDGLVHEFINGTMRRHDWNEMLKLPIGILPTGSGNALSTSILHSAKEMFSVVNAIYVLLKGRPHPMDLFSVFSQTQTYYGFLTVTWGLISDIDIESEKLRALGGLRFTVGAINRIFNLRHYTGVFSYLPGKSLREVESAVEESEHECSSTSPAFSTEDIEVVNDNVCHDRNHYEEIGSCSNTDTSTIYNSRTDNLTTVNSMINNPTSFEPGVPTASHTGEQNETVYGPKCNLPDLNQPLPDDWVTIEGGFINIILTSQSHIGSDLYCAPGTCIDDGVLNLQVIKQGPKTGKILKLFTSLETGKHVEFPEVEVQNVTAFRLIPASDYEGHVVVDGELINYEPIQGEVYPSFGTVIMMPVTA